MRNLFLVLLLANLGFAAWHAWFSRTRTEGARAGNEGAGITLVKELGERGSRSEGAGPAGAGAGTGAADSIPTVDAGDVSASASRGSAAAGQPAKDQAALPKTVGSAAASEPAASPVSAASAAAAEGGASVSQPAAAAATSVPRQDRCISVGPFRERAQAAAASAKLRKVGYAPSPRAGQGDVLVGYWVYLDGVMPGKQAAGMLAKLHAHGVPDSYVIHNDDSDRISLGVFAEIARADRLRDQVRALGFDPVVADRKRREDVYWVDLSLPSGAELDFAPLQTPGQINRLEQLPCSATGGA